MSDDSPMTGKPFGGRDEKSDDDDTQPGERRLSGDERAVSSPGATDDGKDTASRSAEGGPMTSDESPAPRPTAGIPESVDAPSPADATEGDPPGGSAANQPGNEPQR